MISHYNHILIGAPELPAHYGIPLELQQVSAKEVPDFFNAYLNRPTANNTEYSNRQGPRIRGNQNHRHSRYRRQSSPVPRYNKQTCRSDINSYSNADRSYIQTNYNNRNRHQSNSSPTHMCNAHNTSFHNTGNMECNIDVHPSNTSDILGSLQSQILGLQMHPLQQSTLNSIKIFDGSNKAEFTAWAESIENAARLFHLDRSKLQGTLLKSANYLEIKETSTDKTDLVYIKATFN